VRFQTKFCVEAEPPVGVVVAEVRRPLPSYVAEDVLAKAFE
jgi:hypothetical protein